VRIFYVWKNGSQDFWGELRLGYLVYVIMAEMKLVFLQCITVFLFFSCGFFDIGVSLCFLLCEPFLMSVRPCECYVLQCVFLFYVKG